MAGSRDDDATTTDGPVDLAAVRADDAMLDAACRGSALAPGYGRPDDDERLTDLLAAWRAEVEAEPVPELVTLDEAIAAIREGHHVRDRPGRALPSVSGARRRAGRRVPWGLAVAAAGAIAVLGLGTAVHQSSPGEPLWGVTQVVFASKAEAVQRQADAQAALDRADTAIARGDIDGARGELRSADARIGAVDSDDQEPLREQRDRVSSSLTPGASSLTPSPSGTSDAAAPSGASSTPEPTTSPTTTTTTTTPPAGTAGADGTSGASGAVTGG